MPHNSIDEIDDVMFGPDGFNDDTYFVDSYEYESAVFGEVDCLMNQQ